MKGKTQPRYLWWSLSAASLVGLLASFFQTIERINYAKHPNIPLTCNINAIFSCSNVFDAWQSSVFGFSNSLMCMIFFGVILGVALAGASGAAIGKALRLTMQFFSLFFLAFGAWYLWQSTFAIGYICIFCVACYSAVIAMNWAWLRINAGDLPLSKKAHASLRRAIEVGGDIFVWVLWAILVAAVIIYHFWL